MIRQEPKQSKLQERMLMCSFLFLFVYLFSFAVNDYVRTLGRVGLIFLVCFIIVSVFAIAKYRRYELYLACLFGGMIIIRAVHLFDGGLNNTLTSIVQLAVSLGILLIFTRLKIEKNLIKLYNLFFLGFNVLGYIDFFTSPDKIVFTLFGSMNTFAGVFMFLSLIEMLLMFWQMRPIYLCNLALATVLLLLLNSRTALMTFILIIAAYFVLKLFKNKTVNKYLFPIFLICVAVLLYVYINIADMPFYEWLNALSQKFFGKNIDSGRPDIWRDLLISIKDDFWIGLGNSRADFDYSAHNQFLQILGDSGIIGLLLFLSALCIIWFQYSKFRGDKLVQFCQACLIGIVIYNCFEVALIQNKFALGVIQWFILAVGLQRVIYLNKQKNVNAAAEIEQKQRDALSSAAH